MKIDIEALKKEGFSFEEIESVKRGLDDMENGRTIPYEQVKIEIEKQYYSSKEFRKKIKDSILINGEILKRDIKLEKKYSINNINTYV